ncbi:hypothetical protein [Brumimicrobium mesophilum]|uniref:hypothetical protein n=1 Tax=Brumimicrobium mesophilum TaxID=392717 RepID=UPI000D140007|nr:hypothetical protein [Brumimicrobium mesophilum]
MKITCLLSFVFISTVFSLSVTGQDSYFFNQKNMFSVRASFNPRLIPMRQDNNSYSQDGIGRGTYYQYYDESNKLYENNQRYNLMLNTSYARLYDGNKIIGVEFNYQKHNLTMNENANWYSYQEIDGSYITEPFLISTPVFNVFDIQILSGRFNGNFISPNKHLWTYGLGVRIFSLDQNQNYRMDVETPITDLENLIEDFDRVYVFTRLSINYTYRILITKSLSLDLGINANFGLYQEMDPVYGNPGQSFYDGGNSPIYSRYFVKNKLGHETFFNILYFRSGLSFAL